MKILVYSKDEAVKEFCQSSKGRYGIYLNFLALKDYISNMDENLEPGDLVTLILDYDIEREREMIDDFNTEVSFLDNVFTAYISGETSLKELREHQTSDSSANAYLFKPLSTDAIEQAIEDFEAASTNIMPNPLLAEEVTESVAVEDHSSDDEDAATVIDLNFKNLDKASRDNVEDNEFDDDVLDLGTGDHDCTGVRQVVNSHNEEINLADSETNSKIQNLFDQAFDSDENDDLDLSGDLGDLSLSDSSGILEGIDPLNDDDDDNAEFSLDENAADLSLGDSDDALNLSEDTTEEDEELDDDAFSLDLGDISEINEEVSFVEQEDTKDVAVEAKIEVEAEADEGFEATADFKMEQYGLDAKESPEELYPQEEEEFVETVDPTTTMSQDTEGLNFSIPAPQVAKENEENKSEKAAEKVVSPADNYTIPRMNESEALRYQATIAQLREEREGLLQTINQQKQELAVTQQDGLGTRAELEEAKIEISIMKKVNLYRRQTGREYEYRSQAVFVRVLDMCMRVWN